MSQQPLPSSGWLWRFSFAMGAAMSVLGGLVLMIPFGVTSGLIIMGVLFVPAALLGRAFAERERRKHL